MSVGIDRCDAVATDRSARGVAMTATTAGLGKRHRRPSGAPPPLPRRLPWTTRAWIVLLIALVAVGFVARRVSSVERAINEVDAAILGTIANVRTSALSTVADAVNNVVLGWTMFAVGVGLVLALIVLAPVAAPVHVPRQRARRGDHRADPDRRLRAPSAVRRDDDRRLGRVLVPLGAGGDRVLHGCRLIFGLVVAGRPRTIAKVVGAVVVGVVFRAALPRA